MCDDAAQNKLQNSFVMPEEAASTVSALTDRKLLNQQFSGGDQQNTQEKQMAAAHTHKQSTQQQPAAAANAAATDEETEEDSNLGCADHLFAGAANFQQLAAYLAHGAEEFVRQVWKFRGWRVVTHQSLPGWLKDNDFLVQGHRPEMHSYRECFKSMFRIHTETGNIWTHLIGCIAFVAMALCFMAQPNHIVYAQDKLVFLMFFLGAILCLGFSFLFHTVFCHSQKVGKVFNKLDYCGIAFLTMGSFVPWLYYSFYCSFYPKLVYTLVILVLGSGTITISMFDKFATPPYRPLRAGIFIALGLSGTIPCIHYLVLEGFWNAVEKASLGWLSLMALLYITGAVVYAVRIPERIFPGKFDIIFQSHQIFHVFVIGAAFVHYYGIVKIADYRLTKGDCRGPVEYSVRSDWKNFFQYFENPPF